MQIPDLPLFRHRDTVITPADQNQFVSQFENTMDIMSNGVIPAINTAIQDINQIEQEIIEIGQNAINAISLDTIEDLATYTGSGLVIVKDINRGGTFVSKTEVDIDPNTGILYTVNGGTVFAKLGGGFWVRQFSGDIDVAWFGVDTSGVTNTTTEFRKAILAGDVTIRSNQSILISNDQSIDRKLHIDKGGKLIADGVARLVVVNGQLTSDSFSKAFDGVEVDDKINRDLLTVEGQDFCDRYGDKANYNRVYLSVTGTNTFTVGHVHNSDSEMCTEYTFDADADGFINLETINFGRADHNISSKVAYNAVENGTGFIGSGTELAYTTTVGDKISATFYGKELYFRHYTDTRSGIWDVYIDGTYIKTISTHKTTLRSTSNYYTHHLWSGDTHNYVGENIYTATAHEVILVFKGADPLNASSSGAPRGWFQGIDTFYVGSVPKMTSASRKQIVSDLSIDDFAFRMSPSEAINSEWIPRHSDDTVTINNTYSMSMDNEVIYSTISHIPTEPVTSYVEGNTLRFTTRSRGVHPSSPTVRVIIEREFTITANGLSIDKTFTFTADTFITTGYSNQLGVNGVNVSNIVCNNGLEFAPSLVATPTRRLGYGCSSVLFKGEIESARYFELGYTFGSLRDSIGINKITNNSGMFEGVHFTSRDDKVNKVYASFAYNDWFYIGDKIRLSSRIKPHVLVSPSTNY